MAGEHGDLVVLLLDLKVLEDGAGRGVTAGLAQILAFTNAYTMLHKDNRLAVYAGAGDFCHLVHLTRAGDDASVFPSTALHTRLQELAGSLERARAEGRRDPAQPNASSAGTSAGGSAFALSGALSRALCLIHRLRSGPQSAAAARRKARILCIVASPDVPMQYISVMNAIFSAQRADVVVDALVAAAQDSSFLQQAAHLTDGLYFRCTGTEGLLPYLLNFFSVDTHTRSMLEVTQVLGVDFRASCFCHKRTIELGYVCSVCLSIFCQPGKSCSTCGTLFTSRQQQCHGATAGSADGEVAQ